MTVTFNNITITMESESARQAYDELCALLDEYDKARGGGTIEWETDTYSIDGDTERETSELWPQ